MILTFENLWQSFFSRWTAWRRLWCNKGMVTILWILGAAGVGFFAGAKWATFYMADHWPEIRKHLDDKIEEERLREES